ncbi:MAG TPA: uroporphyrinogen decarboxylase family protein [Phycisphaerae bacterium]|nr:uroporphyrinogen decarboxylase family protein [Phycisphaerae bacterium]
MNSRDLINQVITFDAAPRIGYHLPAPWPSDLVHAGVADDPAFEPRRWTEGDTEFWTDEWGCTWQRLGGISKGEVAEGALADWAGLGAYRPPDYGLDARYDRARDVFAAAEGLYRIGDIPGCAFNISRKIRRIDRFLMDCLLEPDRVRALNAAVMDQLLTAVGRLAAAGADAVMYPEDWGTQDRLLMAPATFRDLFLPEIERLCAAAADAGVDVWMHSCGYIWDIIDDLRGAGVKVLQFDQPTLYGVDRLNEAFGGRMTFECPVDIQSSVAGLQSRKREVIRAEARRLVETLGSHGGGFIACRYLDEVAIGMESPEWQDAACEAFVEFGGWAPAPDGTVEV